MAWYLDRESKTSVDGDAAGMPSKPDYEHEGSKILISVNSAGTEAPSDRTPGRGSGGHGRDAGGRGRWTGESKTPGTPQRTGSLSEYFSSLVDGSFCSHKFTLVG